MFSYKFRIYPSKTVQQKLNEQLELCRWLYNRLLEELNHAKAEGRRVKRIEAQAMIVKLKEEKPELKSVYSKVLQMVNYQLWSNLKALTELKKRGRRVGRLRFKGRGWFKTLNYNQSGFKLENKKLVLSKVGEIPIELHRETVGAVKGIIVKRENSGRWHAIFQAEGNIEPLPETRKSVGIDVGIKHFLADSEGRQVENPRLYGKTVECIRVRQKQFSRKKKGSASRERMRVKLARTYERLVDQRNDFLHKLSRFYVNNYDVIAIEKLNISGMVQNRNLGERILDAAWGKFFQMLSYKAERAGRTVAKVNPRGTSKEYKHGKLDRDYNAALNILERGVGPGRPEPTPVEMEPLRISACCVVEAGSSLR